MDKQLIEANIIKIAYIQNLVLSLYMVLAAILYYVIFKVCLAVLLSDKEIVFKTSRAEIMTVIIFLVVTFILSWVLWLRLMVGDTAEHIIPFLKGFDPANYKILFDILLFINGCIPYLMILAYLFKKNILQKMF